MGTAAFPLAAALVTGQLPRLGRVYLRFCLLFGFVGLAGILVVLLPGTSLPAPGMTPWLALAFGAPVCYAFGAVSVVLLRPPGSKPIPLTCGISFASALLMLPVMAAGKSWWSFDAGMTDGAWALLGSAAITAVFFSTNGYIGTLAGMG